MIWQRHYWTYSQKKEKQELEDRAVNPLTIAERGKQLKCSSTNE
jgi:hypothetical protein